MTRTIQLPASMKVPSVRKKPSKRTREQRRKRLATAFLEVADFLLRHPEAVGVVDGEAALKEKWKADRLREYLKNFADASRDVCSYCDSPVVLSEGERVCTKDGHVQPPETIRVANVFYRQVVNYGVWDKNLGTDPMETFKIAKALIYRDLGVNIRSPTDVRRFGDPEDLVLRKLLGDFSWWCTWSDIPAAVISTAARLVRKRHRRYMEEVTAKEMAEAESLVMQLKNDLLNHDGRAQVALNRFLTGTISLDGHDDPREKMAREMVGGDGFLLSTTGR